MLQRGTNIDYINILCLHCFNLCENLISHMVKIAFHFEIKLKKIYIFHAIYLLLCTGGES